MKKIILMLLFVVFSQNISNAQAAINVVITGECADVGDTYTFSGLLNGKNNYVKTFVIQGNTIVLRVGFDNTKWILYRDGDLLDDGFRNNTVPAGVVPPFTGWINIGCLNGTMTINQTLSTNTLDNFEKNVLIYPNPSTNFIIIENTNAANVLFDYKIIDLTGRIVGNGNSKFNEKITIEKLQNASYIIEIKSDNGVVVNKKFIKN